MTTAREYFGQLAQAVIDHRGAELDLAFGPPCKAKAASHGPADPVMARVECNERARRTLAETEAVIGRGLMVIDGLRKIFAARADVLELRYVDLLPWDDAAAELGVSRATAARWHDELLDWVDAHGLAHAAYGYGAAEVGRAARKIFRSASCK